MASLDLCRRVTGSLQHRRTASGGPPAGHGGASGSGWAADTLAAAAAGPSSPIGVRVEPCSDPAVTRSRPG